MDPKEKQPKKELTGAEKRIMESREEFVTAEMQRAKGLRKITAGLRAAQIHKNREKDRKAKRKGQTTLGGRALRFFGHEKTAKWYDRFLGEAAKEEAKGKKPERTGSVDSVGSAVKSNTTNIKVINRKLNMLAEATADMHGDVKDIKSLLMPKFFTAKGKKGTEDEGSSQITQYNPLAPQGEQFRVMTEKGTLTPQKPGKGFKDSALQKAALETAKLALKIQEEDKKKGELRKMRNYSDPKETDPTVAKDPVAMLRVDMNKQFKKTNENIDELDKKTEDDGGGIFSDIADLIKDWRALGMFFSFARALGRMGLVGFAAWAGYTVGSWIWDNYGTKILDGIFAIKDWWENLDILSMIEPITAGIRKVTDFLHITKKDEDYKKKEAENAKAGRTRGGVASAKGPTMDQSIEMYDKRAKDDKLTPKERAENARVRDTLINQKMQRAAGAPVTASVGQSSYEPTQGPSSRGRKVAPVGTLRKEEPKTAAPTPAQATGGKEAVMQAMDQAGITGAHRASLMAQLDHESGGFKRLEENLNYSAKGLLKTFGKYYKTEEQAQADARNPQAIANRVYGGRMGNSQPGDGYRYRGRGFIQLTGKDNYKAFGEMIGMDLVKNPDLAANPAIAAKIAVAYYKKRVIDKGINAEDVASVTKAINGGSIGLEDRADKFAKYSAPGSTASSGAMVASNVSPAPGISATTVDSSSRQVAASKETVMMASNSPVVVNNNTTNTTKTPPRTLPKASATAKDDSFVRTAARDNPHPAYA